MIAPPLAVLARSAIIAQDAVAAGPATAGALTVSLILKGATGQHEAEGPAVRLCRCVHAQRRTRADAWHPLTSLFQHAVCPSVLHPQRQGMG